MKPRLLDLFCGAGGASYGYDTAGFDVTGVDIKAQPNYPFEFWHRDALEVLEAPQTIAMMFDAIHASPPCQGYSSLKGFVKKPYPLLISEVRQRLNATGLPWVIENVNGAARSMQYSVVLCGSAFGLGVWRHRLFETSFLAFSSGCRHKLCPEPVDVTGTGGPIPIRKTKTGGNSRKPKNLAHARSVMGIEWMTRPEISEAIPPAYTEFIGEQLLRVVEKAA